MEDYDQWLEHIRHTIQWFVVILFDILFVWHKFTQVQCDTKSWLMWGEFQDAYPVPYHMHLYRFHSCDSMLPYRTSPPLFPWMYGSNLLTLMSWSLGLAGPGADSVIRAWHVYGGLKWACGQVRSFKDLGRGFGWGVHVCACVYMCLLGVMGVGEGPWLLTLARLLFLSFYTVLWWWVTLFYF